MTAQDRVSLSGLAFKPFVEFWKSRLVRSNPEFAFTQRKGGHSLPGEKLFSKKQFVLPAEKADKISRLVNADNMGIWTCMVAAVGLLLRKYVGQENVIIDTPSYPGDSKNSYSQTVPLFLAFPGNRTLRDNLKTVRSEIRDAYTYQDFPVNSLSEAKNGLAYSTNVAMFYKPLHSLAINITAYDLLFAVEKHNEVLRVEITYRTTVFEDYVIANIPGHLQAIIGYFDSLDVLTKEIDLLSFSERSLLLNEFNTSTISFSSEGTVLDLLQKQVLRTPEKPAVVFEGASLSYQGLDEASTRLALYLRKNYFDEHREHNIIGLMLQPSERTVIAILGILKAGAAFLPVESAFPASRKREILKEADVRALVIDAESMFEMDLFDRPMVVLDVQLPTLQIKNDDRDLLRPVTPDGLAYVIYTSGSTGKPKGVQIAHRSLYNYVTWLSKITGLTEADSSVLMSSYAFDLGYTAFWGSLLNGGGLHLLPVKTLHEPGRLVEYIKSHAIQFIKTTPSQFFMLLHIMEKEATYRTLPLRMIILGGEPIRVTDIESYLKYNPGAMFMNHYGPTETTIGTVFHLIPPSEVVGFKEQPVIGNVITNNCVHILDSDAQLSPVGLWGELYIGGAGLGMGYLHRPDLTADRFKQVTWLNGQTLYKSGDVARRLPDGRIQLSGRNDDQLKIRGYRVELGEVLSTLKSHPAVGDAYLFVSESSDGEKSLTAFASPSTKNAFTLKQVLHASNGNPNLHSNLHYLPNGMPVFHPSKDELEQSYRFIFQKHGYTQYGVSLEENDIVIDVGANVGLFSLYATLHYPGVKVFAMEPVAEIFEYLEKNAALYPVHITPMNSGLGERRMTVDYLYFPHLTSLSGRVLDDTSINKVIEQSFLSEAQAENLEESKFLHESNISARSSRHRVRCELHSLNDFIADKNIVDIGLLKINVEFGELDVLNGLSEENWKKVRQIVVRIRENGVHVTAVEQLLERRGFTFTTEQADDFIYNPLFTIYALRTFSGQGFADPERVTVQFNDNGTFTSSTAAEKSLHAYCADVLPDYMVPAQFYFLEKLPLNTNGKVDKRVLADIKRGLEDSADILLPRTETERKLVQLWEEVLHRKNIGISDNFFKVGGHSLKGVHLMTRLYETFHYKMDLRCIFEKSTIQELAELIDSGAGQHAAQDGIAPLPPQPYYRASHAQQRLWLLSQLERHHNAYNQFRAFLIEGSVDIASLQKAFDYVIERHEILRTTLELRDGEVVQKVLTTKEAEFSIDVSVLTDGALAQRNFDEILRNESQVWFDLATGPLLRVGVVKLSESKQYFLLNTHHIISDAWSLEILIAELFNAYKIFRAQDKPQWAPLVIQYKDYSEWQRQQLSGLEGMAHETYWLNKLAGDLAVPNLTGDKPRPAQRTYAGANLHVSIPAPVGKALKDLSAQVDASLFMGVTASVNAFLYRYTNSEDIILGTVATGRTHADLSGQVGFYLNMLPLRTSVNRADTFERLIEKVKDVALEAYDHQIYPFDKLVGKLNVSRDLSRNPLFDVVVMLETGDSDLATEQLLKSVGIRLAPVAVPVVTSKYDITFIFKYVDDQLDLVLNYNTDIFSAERIQSLAVHFVTLLGRLVKGSAGKICSFEYLTADERYMLIERGMGSRQPLVNAVTIHALFDQQALHRGAEIALTDGVTSLTYQEVKKQSDRLANHLISHYSVRTGDVIGLLTDRSVSSVVAMLSILKAGAAYLPIDSEFPEDRKRFIIGDSGIRLLVTQEKWQEAVVGSVETFLLETSVGDTFNSLPTAVEGRDLAYVMYTSGSTGRPKGVEVTHRSVINFLLSMASCPGMTATDKVLATTTFSFDISVLEIFLPLVTGAAVRIASKEERLDPNKMISLLAKEQPTLMQATPTLWNSLINAGWEGQQDLRVLCGGEPLTKELSEKLLSRCLELWNMYGPTETTIWSTCKQIASSSPSITVGRPIHNTSVYILDEHENLVGDGLVGEICIGGEGVARGYRSRADLTAVRFLDDHLIEGQRIYKTGDMGRWNERGELEIGGRNDHQVKIRGYRIEPGEIEKIILAYPGMEEAIVHVWKIGVNEPLLVGYIVAKVNVDVIQLRMFLLEQLPVYMIPAQIMQLEKLPTTFNGKVDRKALPDPTENFADETLGKPENIVEERVLLVWKEVLQRDHVSVLDNFFLLGGHSLTAVQAIAKVNERCSVNLELKNLFEHPTIRTLSIKIIESDPYFPRQIPSVGEQPYYPASFGQKRLWMLHQLEDQASAYNLFGGYEFHDHLDAGLLEKSFHALLNRHESLRTVFSVVEGELMQTVLPVSSVAFDLDVADLSHSRNEDELSALLLKVQKTAFDLETGPLLRATLVRKSDGRQGFLFAIHHIIADAWSMSLLAREVLEIYHALSLGEEPKLQPLRIHYKDFTHWQIAQLMGAGAGELRTYWHKKLSGSLPVLNLPIDFKRPVYKTYHGREIQIQFDGGTLEKLRAFSQEQGVTTFMTMLSGVQCLLGKYTSQDDILLGLPVAGRDHPDLQNQIGFFVNTVALRTRMDASLSFVDAVLQTKQEVLESYACQHYPFDQLVEELGLANDTSRSPVFDVMVTYQGANFDHSATANKISGKSMKVTNAVARFDLTFNFWENDGEAGLVLNYNTDLFEDTTAVQMARHYKELLSVLLKSPSNALSSIQYLTQEEQEVLHSFNDTCVDYPALAAHQLFEKQSARSPEAVAIVVDDRAFTYEQVNQYANQVARYLIDEESVRPGDKVAIMLERSEWLIISILGILKTGAAYVPVDYEYPANRKNYILTETGVRLLISEEAGNITNLACIKAITVDRLRLRIERFPSDNVSYQYDPLSLAYILYTSGSTGKPKGVMIAHEALTDFVLTSIDCFDITADDTAIQQLSISFDMAVQDIFPILCCGGRLVILKGGLRDIEGMRTSIVCEKVTIISTTPTVVNELNIHPADLETVRLLISAGEKLKTNYIDQMPPTMRICNAYGPTEATVFATTNFIDTKANAELIGRPMANQQVYVLDKHLSLVPAGVKGELFIGGKGLAKGYLNADDLTEEKFINHPFRRGEKLYRTGDLARWNRNGMLVFEGRKDHQIKFRGFRIEMGEIESVLATHKCIVDAFVRILGTSDEQSVLVAYVRGIEIPTSELQQFLQMSLPHYMIPAHVVWLPEFPLTATGKIDYNALPKPSDHPQHREIIAPSNAVEEMLLSIWKEVLNVSPISTHDDFFELGGHSIRAFQVMSRIHKFLDVKLALKVLFEERTLERLAKRISQTVKTGLQAIGMQPQQTYYDVSHSQKRLWLMDQWEEALTAYNLSYAYLLEGDVDVRTLASAFDQLIERHEILRTTFHLVGGELKQKVHDAQHFTPILIVEDAGVPLTHSEVNELSARASNVHFDLEVGPLLRVRLVRVDDRQYALFFTIHHIVSDAWSEDIIMDDVLSAYTGAYKSPLKIQYRDYASWQNKMIEHEASRHRSYWLERFDGTLPKLNLQTLRRPEKRSYRGDKIELTLSHDVSLSLKSASQCHQTTLFTVVLSVYYLLLHKLSGDDDIVVGTPVGGREHPDLEDQVGLYVNTLALRAKIDKNETISEFIDRVKNDVTAAFEHQAYPFDKLMRELVIPGDASRSPLFDAGLTWQNANVIGARLSQYSLPFDVIPLGAENKQVKTDLWLHGAWLNNRVSLTLSYNTDLFTPRMAQEICHTLEQLLSGAMKDTNKRLTEIEITHSLKNDTQSQSFMLTDKEKKLEKFFQAKKTDPTTTRCITKISQFDFARFPLIVEPNVAGVILARWMEDNKTWIKEQLKTNGALLFRNFAMMSMQTFREASQAVGDYPMSYMDQSSPRTSLGDKLYTSTDHPADQTIKLHSELSYSSDWPLQIFFYCDMPAEQGGETPISDNREFLKHLSETTKALFREKGIRYVRNLVDGVGLSWQSVYQTTDKSVVENYCIDNNISFEWVSDKHLRVSWTRAALQHHPYSGEEIWFNHGYFFNAHNLGAVVHEVIEREEDIPFNTFFGDGTPISREIIAELAWCYEKSKISFPWQKGDVLMLDNMLMSHGRNHFTGSRKVLVAMNDPYSMVQAAAVLS